MRRCLFGLPFALRLAVETGCLAGACSQKSAGVGDDSSWERSGG